MEAIQDISIALPRARAGADVLHQPDQVITFPDKKYRLMGMEKGALEMQLGSITQAMLGIPTLINQFEMKKEQLRKEVKRSASSYLGYLIRSDLVRYENINADGTIDVETVMKGLTHLDESEQSFYRNFLSNYTVSNKTVKKAQESTAFRKAQNVADISNRIILTNDIMAVVPHEMDREINGKTIRFTTTDSDPFFASKSRHTTSFKTFIADFLHLRRNK